MTTKIAFPTDDGETISRHFGQANYFQVITLVDGTATQKEQRQLPAHQHHEHNHNHEHGHGHGHHNKFTLLQDCQVLIGAGMGQPAHNRLQEIGVDVWMTGEKTIAAALEKYISGTLSNDMRRVHAHHDHDHDDHHSHTSIHFVDEQ